MLLIAILRRQNTAQVSSIDASLQKQLSEIASNTKYTLSATDKIQEVHTMLNSSQKRGVLGEVSMRAIAENILPSTMLSFQHPFSNAVSTARGDAVDLAIAVGDDRLLPVDSKFSYESYRRFTEEPNNEKENSKKVIDDLKKHITVTSKYIRPAEKTTDFALMFVPSEAIYYDLMTDRIKGGRALIDDSLAKNKVLVVSPTSFVAYLQVILHGHSMSRLTVRNSQLRKEIAALDKQFNSYSEKLVALVKSTEVNNSKAEDLSREWTRMQGRLQKFLAIEDDE